jgi:hypothetical protein
MYRPAPRNRQINIFHGTEEQLKLTFDGEVYAKDKLKKDEQKDKHHRFFYYKGAYPGSFIWVRNHGLATVSMMAMGLKDEFYYAQNFWGARRDYAISKSPQREQQRKENHERYQKAANEAFHITDRELDALAGREPAPIRSYKDD